MIINQAARFNFGFASNMVLLLWCVCGGFILHFLECNFLTILLKPTFEPPVDTPQDILDRGMTIINIPGTESNVENNKISFSKVTRDHAEVTIVPKV